MTELKIHWKCIMILFKKIFSRVKISFFEIMSMGQPYPKILKKMVKKQNEACSLLIFYYLHHIWLKIIFNCLFLQFLKICPYYNQHTLPVGSMWGPRLVCDPMGVGSCVLRVLWYVFCCLECKNITLMPWGCHKVPRSNSFLIVFFYRKRVFLLFDLHYSGVKQLLAKLIRNYFRDPPFGNFKNLNNSKFSKVTPHDLL